MLTVNPLGIPSSLRRSLVSANIIESPNTVRRARTFFTLHSRQNPHISMSKSN